MICCASERVLCDMLAPLLISPFERSRRNGQIEGFSLTIFGSPMLTVAQEPASKTGVQPTHRHRKSFIRGGTFGVTGCLQEPSQTQQWHSEKQHPFAKD